MVGVAFLVLFFAAVFGYIVNRRAAEAIRSGGSRLHSLTFYHGGFAALLAFLPAFVVLLFWIALQGPFINALVMRGLPEGATDGLDAGATQLILAEIVSISRGQIFGTPESFKIAAAERLNALNAIGSWMMIAAMIALTVLGLFLGRRAVAAEFRARQAVERIIHGLMVFCSIVAIFTTIGIIFSLVFESYRFFERVPLTEFLFGLNWEPQIPIRADQIAGAGAFGWLPVILGTLVVTVIAMAFSVPIGLLSAIYLNEFASPGFRKVAKPVLEVLAGIPTVVYGFFAVLTVAPALRAFGADIGLEMSPNTALAAGGVMAIMLIPFISSFTDDALSAVPQSLRDGSLALGATRGETVLKVLFPAAIPGIVGGVLLAVSRAIGETMIVVMAAGIIAKLTINPLDSVTTVTVQIVTLLIGDTSFDNPKTLAAFALGLMLFIMTLGINIVALRIVRKYREIYD
jgi:phosphate transport system permease protein